MRVAIIDDEPPARQRLRQLLHEVEDATVVGEAANVGTAVALLNVERPDVALLDVRLPDGEGFDVLRRADWLPVAVIFVTAFDEHAVRAFEVGALDYLVKPVHADRFHAALDRARRATESEGEEGEEEQNVRLAGLRRVVEDGPRFVERLAIRIGKRIRLVPIVEIECFLAAGNYLQVCLKEGTYLIRESMQRMEDRLDPAAFIRIHRSTIVNIHRVSEIEPQLHGDYTLRLQGGRRLQLSRTFRDRFRGRFGPEF